MAESLEGSRDMDCDKKMDSLGYSREQFDKFIHDYRELAEPSSYNSHESNTSIDAALKKDFINVERKLTKIFYAVRKLPKTEALNGLCLRVESMLDIFKMLKIVKEDNEEFSLDNVPLPDYDAADMELLLGKEFSSTKVIRKNGLSKFKNKLREQIIENIRIAKILLEECDETVSLHQEKGDCIVWSFIESKNQKSEIKWMRFKICGCNEHYGFFARITAGNQGVSFIKQIHSPPTFPVDHWPERQLRERI